MDLKSQFKDVVTSEDQFRAVMGYPASRTLKTELSYLDEFCRLFIGRSPFLVIGSCDRDGRIDMSPRGDPPGFVQVLDEKTLAIPDRPGNRRADTFKNILENDHVGLLFFVPGKQETLRVSGHAVIVRDSELRQRMAIDGKSPDFAIVVGVEQAFFQCAKCVIRSNLWNKDAWPAVSGLPSQAETIVAAAKLDISVEQMEAIIDEDRRTRLY